MVCFVYRPKIRGRLCALWSGRYRFDDMPKPVTVPLRTPDELVARTRLQNLIVRLQRQKEGLAASEPMREAAGKPFAAVVTDYAADLRAQERHPQHIKDTSRRLLRIARESRWRTVGDATAASFTAWRARLTMVSAKTRKDYQVSLNAFFRWMIATERFDRNPFAKVTMPETRGKAVRRRRAFAVDELCRLLAVASHRRLAYLFMVYTGTRYREAWGLPWSDVLLDHPAGPHVIIRAERAKDREPRPIPLHPELAKELRAHRLDRAKDGPEMRVFRDIFPSQRGGGTGGKGSFRRDLDRAGIPQRDATGRVLDFHSFRKTWQTMGVQFGVNQRVAQAILGHSTPELTAGPYTDVAGLDLHREIAKFPWIADSLPAAPEGLKPAFFAMVDATGLEPVTPCV